MANAVRKSAKKAGSTGGKRELIAPKGDKRYIKRNSHGQIEESDDQSRSLRQDRKKTAKTKVKPGYGDKGDRERQ